MKTPSKPPIFLERSRYRQRRLMDTLRLLPVLGVMLWIFPMFWPTGPVELAVSEPVRMSSAVTYVFSIWIFLIATTCALHRILRPTLEQHAAELDDASVSEAR